jgi:hypothetical protein
MFCPCPFLDSATHPVCRLFDLWELVGNMIAYQWLAEYLSQDQLRCFSSSKLVKFGLYHGQRMSRFYLRQELPSLYLQFAAYHGYDLNFDMTAFHNWEALQHLEHVVRVEKKHSK